MIEFRVMVLVDGIQSTEEDPRVSVESTSYLVEAESRTEAMARAFAVDCGISFDEASAQPELVQSYCTCVRDNPKSGEGEASGSGEGSAAP
jgi:hypothetical protein